ncbi:MAG: TonB family protein [Crocinitomix sp.]|nr:TonB family protein [Crocinitomix sp.]
MKFLLFPFSSTAQEEVSEEKVYDFVEEDPEFPGGTDAMTKYIVEHVEYPDKAKELGEQGIVYVKFVVASDGSVTNVSIRKGVSATLDAEATRVISAMPNWIPGMQAGKAVAVNYTLPIHFRLSTNKDERRAKKEEKRLKKALKKGG